MANKKIQLQDVTGQNNLYPIPTFPGIDENNLLSNQTASGSGTQTVTLTYTPTVDAFAIIYNSGNILINNISIYSLSDGYSLSYAIPIKSGDTLTITGVYTIGLKVFGIKYLR